MLGEADLIVELFTDTLGRTSALARGARSSKSKRGVLEPLHTLTCRLEERGERELLTLSESQTARPRLPLLELLERLDAASALLALLRHTPPREPLPELFADAEAVLEGLMTASAARAPTWTAAFGLRLLESLGLGLELERCVRTGVPCPPERSAQLDPRAGGLVSLAAGGGPITLTAQDLAALRAARDGDASLLDAGTGALLTRVVDAVLRHHGPQS